MMSIDFGRLRAGAVGWLTPLFWLPGQQNIELLDLPHVQATTTDVLFRSLIRIFIVTAKSELRYLSGYLVT